MNAVYSHGDMCSSMSSAAITFFRQSCAAPQEPQRAAELAVAQQPDRRLDLERGELEPELRRLVHRHEEELVAV